MELKNAEQLKTYAAEKRIATVRAAVIVFGTLVFLMQDEQYINKPVAWVLLPCLWLYGSYILFFKPYEKYPIFLSSQFTYIGDSVFTTAWLYATGGADSPFYAIFYISIIAVAFRFNLKTTFITATVYMVCYLALVFFMGQLERHLVALIARSGFLYIIGYLSNIITDETLAQTKEKLLLAELVEEAGRNRAELERNTKELNKLNLTLQLNNDLFKHAEENAMMGSYWWQISSNKMDYSDNLFRILGHEPGAFTPSFENYMEFLHPEEIEGVRQTMGETLATKTVPPQVRKLIAKDGALKYIRTTGKFVGTDGQEMMIGTLQDVTQDVRLQETLNAKNRELESTNNELSSFNYIASHDLQEPVRKIFTFGNMILQKEKDALSTSARDYLSRIITSAGRMQRLIEAFSNYSRIGSTAIVFEKTDLNAILASAKDNLADKITEGDVSITSSDLPVVTASPFHMQQLFENLLSNAIKYRSKTESPHIHISAQIVNVKNPYAAGAKNEDYWEIDVKDNGIGFSDKYAEKIFEVFQRLHTKEQYPGTGIGLAICKKIALVHRGFIIARSEENKGAEFLTFISKDL